LLRTASSGRLALPQLGLRRSGRRRGSLQLLGAAEVERVIVTGSNIPTAEEVGPNPVFSLNRDLINKSGQGTTTEQLLKSSAGDECEQCSVNNNGTGQAGPAGTSSISLRGFDPGASLVLIDGRRVAHFPGPPTPASVSSI